MRGACCQLQGVLGGSAVAILSAVKPSRKEKPLRNPAIPHTVEAAKTARAAILPSAEEDDFVRMVTVDTEERVSEKAAPREKSRRGDLTWLTLAGDAVAGAADSVSVSPATKKWCGGWAQRAAEELAKAQGGRGAQRETLRKAILFSGAAYGCSEVVWRAAETKAGRIGGGFKSQVEARAEMRKHGERKMGRLRRLV